MPRVRVLKMLPRRLDAAISEKLLRLLNPRLSPAFSCRSHLTTKERIKLYELSDRCSSIAEIGSYVGASCCCFGASVSKRGKGTIICIDTWNNDAMTEGGRDTWLQFSKNTAPFENFIVPIRGYSTSVVDRVKDVTDRLDLLFIDGDHSYDGVKTDWEAYKGFLGPDSIVVFHDIGWAEGVQRVVHDDVLPLCAEHASLPNMWWGKLGKRP